MPATPSRRSSRRRFHRSSLRLVALLVPVLAVILASPPLPATGQEPPPLLRAGGAAGDGGVELVPATGVGGWRPADGLRLDGAETLFGRSGDLSPFATFDLPAGSSVTIQFDVVVDSPLAGGVFQVGNQSTLTADQVAGPGVATDDPDTGAANDATLTNLLVSADLTASKTDSPPAATAVPGNGITYTVVYGNAGPAGVIDAPVSDGLPASLTGCTWTCAASATGNCDAANGAGDIATTVDLEAGATATFTISCTLDPSATGNLVNLASIAAPGGVDEVGDGSNNTAGDTNTLAPEGDLSLTKTTPSAPVVPGTTETYQVVVANSGPSTAAGVAVSDVFPAANFSNVSWSCVASPGSSCTAGPVAGDLADSVTLLPSGTATYTLTADVAGGVTGTLSNTASLTVPPGFTDTNPGNESDTVNDSTDAQGDLALGKTTLTTPVVPGGNVSYQVSVTNSGPSTAVDAVVTDTFDGVLSSITWTCTASAGSSCPASGSGDLDETVTVASGGSVVFTITAAVDVAASGSLSNTATVTPPAGFDDATDGNDSDTVTDPLVPSGDVAVAKSTLTSPVVAGQPVQYQVVVTNSGPSTLTGATVQDNFSALLANESWSCVASAGSTCTANGSGDLVDVVTLLAGGSATYSISADLLPTASGSLENTASVTVPGGFDDVAPGNESDLTSDPIQVVTDLSVTKTDGVAQVPPGGTLTYTITVTNDGPSTATGATVTDTFPAELSGVTWTCVASAGGTCTAGPVAGDVNDAVILPPGGTATYTASGTGNSIGTVTNTASVAAGAGASDPQPGNNADGDDTFVGSPADVTGTKSVAGDTTLGGTVLYTITLVNGGSGDQLNNPGDELTDVLPPELILVGASVVSGGGGVDVELGTNTVTWNGAIPAGGTVVIEIEATVDAGAGGATVSNQGEIAYDMDGDGTNEASRLTDDPQQPGAEDATVFQAGTVLEIPTLSSLGLALLVLLLAALGLARMRRRGAAVVVVLAALALGTGFAGTAAAQGTVDDFSTAQATVTDPSGTTASTADGAGILGGERDLEVRRLAGANPVTAEAAAGELVFTVGADSRGAVDVTWDGNDDDAATLDPTGLGGVDLTDGGTESGLRLDLETTASGVSLLVEVFTDAGNSSRAGRSLELLAASTAVYVPFRDFQVAEGSGADFTDVGAVRVRLLADGGVGGETARLAHVATAAPALAGTKVDLDTSDVPLGATPVPPGGTIRYRVTVSNSGSEATAVDVHDLVDANTTVVPGSIHATPVPVGDSYAGLGNVTLVVPPAEGLLANDTDPDGDTLTVQAFDAATAAGGTVQNVDVNTGAFEYLPPAGFRGVDTFTYTVTDDDGNLVSAPVHVLLGEVVWFVDSDNEACGPGDCGTGTFADPFETLDQAEAASLPGDWIRLRDGADDLTDHDGGIVLKDGQNLVGEAVALVIDGQMIEAAGSEPELTHAAGGHGIVLGGNNEIRGLQVDGADGTAIVGNGVSNIVLADVSIEDADALDGGAALDLDNVTGLDATFDFVQSNGSATGGIRLNGVAGTLTVAGATSILDPVDHGVRIEASPGLVATFTGGVTVTDAGDGGGADAALHLANNAGATLTFGALSLDVENGDGLFAVNGGTVNLTAPGNVIQVTGGAALDLQGTAGQTSGSPGWTFQSLESLGSPDQGVRLGSLGDDLLVTATTTVVNADGTGILVQNAAGRSVDFGTTSVTDDDVGAGANGNGVDLATGNAGAAFTFDSLNVTTDGGFGLLADGAGSLTVAGGNNDVTANGGFAVSVSNVGSVALSFDDLAATHPAGEGLRLANLAGSTTVDTFNATTTNGVGLFAAAAGSLTISGGGTVTSTNRAAVDVDGTAIAIALTALTSNASNDHGVDLTNLPANASFSVSGLTDVNAPANEGLMIADLATGAVIGFGPVQVDDAGAEGIEIDTVAAGGDLDFGTTDVTNRNATGIFVDEMDGATLDFGVTTIPNPKGVGGYGIRAEDSAAAFTFAAANVSDTVVTVATLDADANGVPENEGDGDALFIIRHAGSFTVNGGTLERLEGSGVDIRGSGGLTLSGVTINDIGQSAANPNTVDDAGIWALDLTGTNRVENSTISRFHGAAAGGDERGIYLLNVGTSFTELRVSNTDFFNDNVLRGDDAIQLLARGAVNGRIVVENGSTFSNLSGEGLQVLVGNDGGSGTVEVQVDTATFQNSIDPGGFGGIAVSSIGSAAVDLDITNSTLTNLYPGNANAGIITLATFGTSSMVANISGNAISDTDGRFGIYVLAEDSASDLDLTIHDNDIDDTDDEGISIDLRGGAVTGPGQLAEVRITQNRIGTVTPVGQDGWGGIIIRARDNLTGSGAKTLNLLIADNVVRAADNGASDEIIDLDAEDSATLNATVTGNDIRSNGSADNELEVASEDPGASVCLDLRNNTASEGAGTGNGTFLLDQQAGTFIANTAGNNGTVTTSGTIGAAASCPLPSP